MPREALSPGKKKFVHHYVRSGDQLYAAQMAGFAQPSKRGSLLMRDPAVLSALEARRATWDDIDRASPYCSKDLVDRITGRKGPEPSHGEAAKLHAVFWKVWLSRPNGDVNLDPSEMSADQLRLAAPIIQAELERVQAELAARARTIEGVEVHEDARNSEDDDGDEVDIFA